LLTPEQKAQVQAKATPAVPQQRHAFKAGQTEDLDQAKHREDLAHLL
jgi:hypothetical protein